MFGNKKYRDSVLSEIIDIIELARDNDTDGLLTVFGEFNASMDSSGLVDLDRVFKGYRKIGLSHREAALSLIDGTISQMKDISKSAQNGGTIALTKELTGVIPRLERAIDGEFRRSPGRIVPRNGSTGRACAESGIEDFLQKK